MFASSLTNELPSVDHGSGGRRRRAGRKAPPLAKIAHRLEADRDHGDEGTFQILVSVVVALRCFPWLRDTHRLLHARKPHGPSLVAIARAREHAGERDRRFRIVHPRWKINAVSRVHRSNGP